MKVSALQGEPFDQGNQVGWEAPSAAAGQVACPPPPRGTLLHASIGGHPGRRTASLTCGRWVRHRCSACDR